MPLQRRIIAVVDDDESMRKALARQLRAAGYRCESFASAEDLLFCLSALVPHGVLSDIQLGAMTGLQLAAHPDVTRRSLPVVLMTGLADPMFEDAARDVAAAFLLKPLCADDLLDAIIEYVGPPFVEDDEGNENL
jgi:FixJ family two-component response regulator